MLEWLRSCPGLEISRAFNMSANLRREIKELIVTELNLEGRDPQTIEDDAPLFGEGLGLDSLDALQLAMSVEEHFGVRIPEGDEARPIFKSVAALAEHVAAHRKPEVSLRVLDHGPRHRELARYRRGETSRPPRRGRARALRTIDLFDMTGQRATLGAQVRGVEVPPRRRVVAHDRVRHRRGEGGARQAGIDPRALARRARRRRHDGGHVRERGPRRRDDVAASAARAEPRRCARTR